jgi:hypothetical protein
MIALAAALAALAVSAPPSVRPTPIGVGHAYRPRAATPSVRAGRRLGPLLSCRRGGRRYGVHLELFANGRVVVVPAGIGVAAPSRRSFGAIVPGGCTYPARTLTPAGVVEVGVGARLTLGDLFRLWHQPLGRRRLAGFRSPRPVLAFVDGRRWHGDPGAIPLARHAQIVLEIGGYVPPHAAFLFPGDL